MKNFFVPHTFGNSVDFLRYYREPLLQFAMYKGKSPTESEDAERGKFRNFLIGPFKRFLAQRLTRQVALKRGGGEPLLSLDNDEAGLSESVGARRDFRFALGST